MKKEMYKFLTILLLGALVAFLSACSSGMVSGSNNLPVSNQVYLDNLGRIPVGAKGLSIFRIHNEREEASAFSSRIKMSAAERKYIIVSTGDTLFNLSRSSKVSIASLKELNKMSSNTVKLGWRFYLA